MDLDEIRGSALKFRIEFIYFFIEVCIPLRMYN
jgi:hypothetical protein